MKAAIIIEPWKLPTFSKILVDNGFHYTQLEGPTKGQYTLTVNFKEEDKNKLTLAVLSAQAMVRKLKKPT